MIISESRRAAEKNPLKNLTKKEALSEIYPLQKSMPLDCASEFNLEKERLWGKGNPAKMYLIDFFSSLLRYLHH